MDQAKNKLGNDAQSAFATVTKAADAGVRNFKDAVDGAVAPTATELAAFMASTSTKADDFAGVLSSAAAQFVEQAKADGTDIGEALQKSAANAIATALKMLQKLESRAVKTGELMDNAVDAGLKEAKRVADAALEHADRVMDAAAAEHQKVTDAASELASATVGGAKKIGKRAGKVIGEAAGDAADDFDNAKNTLNKGFDAVSAAADQMAAQAAAAAGGATKDTLELADKLLGGVVGGAKAAGGAVLTPAGQLAARVNSFLGATGNAVAGAGEQAISDVRKSSESLAKLGANAVEKLETNANAALMRALKALENADPDKESDVVDVINGVIADIAKQAQAAADKINTSMRDAAKTVDGAVKLAVSDAVTVGNSLLTKASSVAQGIAKKDIDAGKAMASITAAFDAAVVKSKTLVDKVATTIKKPDAKKPETNGGSKEAEAPDAAGDSPDASGDGSVTTAAPSTDETPTSAPDAAATTAAPSTDEKKATEYTPDAPADFTAAPDAADKTKATDATSTSTPDTATAAPDSATDSGDGSDTTVATTKTRPALKTAAFGVPVSMVLSNKFDVKINKEEGTLHAHAGTNGKHRTTAVTADDVIEDKIKITYDKVRGGVKRGRGGGWSVCVCVCVCMMLNVNVYVCVSKWPRDKQ